MTHLKGTTLLIASGLTAAAAQAQTYSMTWSTIDCGGTAQVSGGAYTLAGTCGQPDAQQSVAAGTYSFAGGYWPGLTAFCYANCDASTSLPLLTANDFQCFLNRFASSDPYANCDGSTATPVLTANDFQCFLNKFAEGCP